MCHKSDPRASKCECARWPCEGNQGVDLTALFANGPANAESPKGARPGTNARHGSLFGPLNSKPQGGMAADRHPLDTVFIRVFIRTATDPGFGGVSRASTTDPSGYLEMGA